MKRLISLIIVLSMLFGALAVNASALDGPSASEIVASYFAAMGDANGDGTVGTDDARYALRIAAGLENPESFGANTLTNADVDGITGVSTSDARSILRYAIGLQSFEAKLDDSVLIDYFVTLSNSVKADKPGLDRKTTVVCPSIKVTMSDTEIENWEMYQMKDYFDEKIAEIKKYENVWGLILSKEKIAELNALIEQWEAQKESIDKAYEPQIDEFHVEAGKSHNAQYTVRGKSWASRATAEDIESVKLEKLNGELLFTITYADYQYTELPTEISTLPYGKMFDLSSTTTLTKPSRTDFDFHYFNVSDGKVTCTVDKDTGALSESNYYFRYLWSYTVTSKDSSGNESKTTYTYTVDNTSEYDIAAPQVVVA